MRRDKLDRIVFKLPEELKKEFQILVIKNNKDMTTVLVSLVEEYVRKNGQEAV